jgi:hypothetical protein
LWSGTGTKAAAIQKEAQARYLLETADFSSSCAFFMGNFPPVWGEEIAIEPLA